ncbi:MAG TPA: MFS transporter, partial [Gaiellaceae bacterium]|nr:MFS transporter [Gaiellaceae bacterium]
MSGLAERVRDVTGPVIAVFRVRALRLMEIARAAALLATGGSTIVFVVVTYRLGGAGAVAALAVIRLVVTTVAAPFGAILGDRYDRVRVIVAADAARVLNLLAAAAAAAWTSSLSLQLGLAALTTAIGMVSAPARGALLPALAETPEMLTAANVVAGATDTVASLVGPALAGVALAVSGPTAAFAAAGVVAALSPAVVSRIQVVGAEAAAEQPNRPGLTRAAFAGFGAVVSSGPARALLALYSVVSLAGGALTVLFTVAAIRLLGLGGSGVGFLYSFFSG